jgi:hypothetical protein
MFTSLLEENLLLLPLLDTARASVVSSPAVSRRQPATTPAVSSARSSQQPATTPPTVPFSSRLSLTITTTISSASASSARSRSPVPLPLHLPPQPGRARLSLSPQLSSRTQPLSSASRCATPQQRDEAGVGVRHQGSVESGHGCATPRLGLGVRVGVRATAAEYPQNRGNGLIDSAHPG